VEGLSLSLEKCSKDESGSTHPGYYEIISD